MDMSSGDNNGPKIIRGGDEEGAFIPVSRPKEHSSPPTSPDALPTRIELDTAERARRIVALADSGEAYLWHDGRTAIREDAGYVMPLGIDEQPQHVREQGGRVEEPSAIDEPQRSEPRLFEDSDDLVLPGDNQGGREETNALNDSAAPPSKDFSEDSDPFGLYLNDRNEPETPEETAEIRRRAREWQSDPVTAGEQFTIHPGAEDFNAQQLHGNRGHGEGTDEEYRRLKEARCRETRERLLADARAISSALPRRHPTLEYTKALEQCNTFMASGAASEWYREVVTVADALNRLRQHPFTEEMQQQLDIDTTAFNEFTVPHLMQLLEGRNIDEPLATVVNEFRSLYLGMQRTGRMRQVLNSARGRMRQIPERLDRGINRLSLKQKIAAGVGAVVLGVATTLGLSSYFGGSSAPSSAPPNTPPAAPKAPESAASRTLTIPGWGSARAELSADRTSVIFTFPQGTSIPDFFANSAGKQKIIVAAGATGQGEWSNIEPLLGNFSVLSDGTLRYAMPLSAEFRSSASAVSVIVHVRPQPTDALMQFSNSGVFSLK